MTKHTALIQWPRSPAPVHDNQFTDHQFTDNQYSREHTWTFDGGLEVLASASPHVVPLPYANPSGVDPEEAFVAALSSCHMLWFLSIAAQRKAIVERYIDHAVGIMASNQQGQMAITTVYLRPQVRFGSSPQPTNDEIKAMHTAAHHRCFLANSVKSDVIVEAILP